MSTTPSVDLDPTRPRPVGSDRVRLLDGPFLRAQETGLRYLLELDADRLLAPYLEEAGLVPDAPRYGNWETDGLGGHIGGHYLSALAKHAAVAVDEDSRALLLARIEHVLDGFERAQDAIGTGYLGGVPDGPALAVDLASGRVDADLFDLDGRWVPLYNLHKTLAGLLDAAIRTDSPRALAMAVRFGDWWLGVSDALDDAAFASMLRTEFGGLNDALAELAAVTGRADLRAAALRFRETTLAEPLASGRDELDGLHANTQIPKIVGYARLAADAPATDATTAGLGAAAAEFWKIVTRSRSYVIGGNSLREHFVPAGDAALAAVERQGPESCNSYNMLALTAKLLASARTPAHGLERGELLDFAERVALNHVLSSQHPEHGGLVYFTPLRPAHYRVYSQPHTSMWCCVGTGLENHASYGELVFAATAEALHVDLYRSAELDWIEQGAVVRLVADPLRSDEAILTIDAASALEAAVRLRRPGWAEEMVVEADAGARVRIEADGTAVVDAIPAGSTTVRIRFEAALVAEPLPGDAGWVSFRYGPVVLAARAGAADLDGLLADEARMAHVAAGPLVPLAATPLVIGDPLARVRLTSRDPLRVELETVRIDEDGRPIPTTGTLEPFVDIHDERYLLSWPVGVDAAARHGALVALDEAAAADELVVDAVVAGEQQPESDHGFAGDGSRAGGESGVHWRGGPGWFSYVLTDDARSGTALRFRFRAGAPEPIDVRSNGTPLLGGSRTTVDGVVELAFDVEPAERRTVSVHAVDGSTGELLSVALLRTID